MAHPRREGRTQCFTHRISGNLCSNALNMARTDFGRRSSALNRLRHMDQIWTNSPQTATMFDNNSQQVYCAKRLIYSVVVYCDQLLWVLEKLIRNQQVGSSTPLNSINHGNLPCL